MLAHISSSVCAPSWASGGSPSCGRNPRPSGPRRRGRFFEVAFHCAMRIEVVFDDRNADLARGLNGLPDFSISSSRPGRP